MELEETKEMVLTAIRMFYTLCPLMEDLERLRAAINMQESMMPFSDPTRFRNEQTSIDLMSRTLDPAIKFRAAIEGLEEKRLSLLEEG